MNNDFLLLNNLNIRDRIINVFNAFLRIGMGILSRLKYTISDLIPIFKYSRNAIKILL